MMGLNNMVRPDVLARIRSVFDDASYREIIESSSTYNNGIVVERKLRLPYLDSQTGVAQSDCCLWMQKSDRMPGGSHGQIYSYPAKRWKKKRRQYLMNDNYLTRARQSVAETVESGETPSVPTDSSTPGASRPETNSDSADKFFENSKDAWFGDYDDGSDLPDAGELDDPESDFDDYEEYGKKKKKKKTETPKRKRVEYSDAEKPYSCDLCGARYKTRPGLSYHYSHSHQNDGSGGSNSGGATEPGGRGSRPDDEAEPPFPLPRPPHANNNGPSSGPQGPPGLGPPMSSGPPHGLPPHLAPPPNLSAAVPPGAPPLSQHARNSPITTQNNSQSTPPPSAASRPEDQSFEGNRPSGKPLASPSQYCDFCLGDSVENKKTKSAESLVSCSDCGRSAHPTCLQFTPNMITSVKKYRWQCIECKSCGLCGTSDNDDQLLFCDDCDRGYHMYCLKPPLSEPPEGSWSCHLCIVEYHQNTPKSK